MQRGSDVVEGREELEKLAGKKEELLKAARENDETSRKKAKEYYDVSKKPSTICRGDYILLRKEKRIDSLEAKFDGPFRVVGQKGTIVKIKVRNKKKWVHVNRCKKYEGGWSPGYMTDMPGVTNSQVEQIANSPDGEDNQSSPEENFDSLVEEAEGTSEPLTESSQVLIEEVQTKRYPSRLRKPVKWHEDYVKWDSLSKDRWREHEEPPPS